MPAAPPTEPNRRCSHQWPKGLTRCDQIPFTRCSLLVQGLLAANRDFRLEKLLRQLSRFEALIVDDLGYVQHSREEMEVLFTLLAER